MTQNYHSIAPTSDMQCLILLGLLGTALCHGPKCSDDSRPLCSDGSRGLRGPPTCSDGGLPLTCSDGSTATFKSPCEDGIYPVALMVALWFVVMALPWTPVA